MAVETTALTTALDNLADTDYQVWASTPTGGLYAYRTELIYSVALNWSDSWNRNVPADVLPGTTFLAIRATTRFEVV